MDDTILERERLLDVHARAQPQLPEDDLQARRGAPFHRRQRGPTPVGVLLPQRDDDGLHRRPVEAAIDRRPERGQLRSSRIPGDEVGEQAAIHRIGRADARARQRQI
jgi:hypothetical protein